MKKIVIVFLATIAALTLNSCGNADIIDTVYTYDWAIIQMPNGEIFEGKVQSWRGYRSGDQIQVKIEGKTYLVHANNICLIAKED